MGNEFRTSFLVLNGQAITVTGQTLYVSGSPVGAGNTGILTGQFYPLNNNPSGFITGLNTGSFITTSQTGNFVDRGQTGNFIDAGLAGSFITTGQTGAFSPIKSGFLYLPVQSMKLLSGSPAQIDASEPNWRTLFDQAVNESGLWQFIMPVNYVSNPEARIHYSMNITQTGIGNVVWKAYISPYTPNVDPTDIITGNFAINSGIQTLTSGQIAGWPLELVIPLTGNNSLAANDFVSFILQRDAVTDTATGDAELLALNIQYR